MDQQWCTHSLMYLPQVFDFAFDSRSRSSHAGNNPAIESSGQFCLAPVFKVKNLLFWIGRKTKPLNCSVKWNCVATTGIGLKIFFKNQIWVSFCIQMTSV